MNNGVAVCGAHHTGLAGDDAETTSGDYIPHHQGFQYYKQTSNPHHLPPTSTAMIGQTDAANHQYDLADFLTALAAGKMPAVTYLKAAAYQDGHAGYSDPIDEQVFLVNTINTILQSPFWKSTAIIISYDDSDGFYDHVMGPIVSPSAVSDDQLDGAGMCGSGANAATLGRCGYGPRLPLLVISPYAKANYVDHTTTDQSSILRFIEHNWDLGRIGNGSSDAWAGSLNGMFDFASGYSNPAVFLDPNTGLVSAASVTTPGGSPTKAVANPKNLFTTVISVTLDGTKSASGNGQLTYTWTAASNTPAAQIVGANTATPTVYLLGGPGLYTFTLTVTYSTGATATDTATVDLLP